MIDLPKADLMNLFADGVANLIPENVIDSLGFLHRLSILLPILKPFPPDETAYSHDGPRQRAAAFTRPSHTPGQSASRLEYLLASHTQLFLQSCKNGLGSAKIGHVVLEGQLEDLIQELLSILHLVLLLVY